YELYDLFVFFVSHSNIISPLWGAFLLFFKQSQEIAEQTGKSIEVIIVGAQVELRSCERRLRGDLP
ncbi:hypothetical protein, partial [Hydrogenobacter hydrogenophilus]